MQYIFILILSVVGASAFGQNSETSASPKQCPVSGKSSLWEADYCVYKSESHDFHSQSAQTCLVDENPEIHKLSDDCEKKMAFKKKLCAFLSNTKHADFDKICVRNEVPDSVARAGG